ncbi:YigZ family protein [Solihabitans fulvus]|uniref:YigZ family protein n=1 Tax=Solihabitans fulvus TaxID=1892852 RepID=A0A5B2XFX6_9PSEU|nr:YigZ family protein [Solihabitans fulvus]KAA2261692.1 YigZ family protein [Solihabitans fulvus]
MPEQYHVVACQGTHEIEIKKSRFLCSLGRAEDERAAEEFIAAVRKAHWNATHNCTAYRIGPGGQAQKTNDDGEPGGTAGVPMLEVLRRREVTDTVAVVTRHFGGVMLGAGGLIRAYSRAVAEAIDAVGLVRRVPFRAMTVTVGHAEAGRLEHALHGSPYLLGEISYAERVTVLVHVPIGEVDAFAHWIAEQSNGRADVAVGGEVLLELP